MTCMRNSLQGGWKIRFRGEFNIKALKLPIISVGLAIFFFIAAHFFLTTYNRYFINRKKAEVLTVQARLLKQQKNEAELKKHGIFRAKNFIDRAKSLGLEENRWAVYDINIEEPVTFSEMEQILNQCANSSAYYFKPIIFYAKKTVQESDKERMKKAISVNAHETKQRDMLLTLKGVFYVRD